MTGYNSNTGDVELVIGEHVNNKNQFLPRYIEGSKYINKEFYDSEKHRIDEFRATPEDLLEKIHSGKDWPFRKSER